MEESRLKYEKPSNYTNRVLVGSWVEERCSYKKNNFLHTTNYSHDYAKKPLTTNDPGIIWDAKIKAEGIGIYSANATEDPPNTFDNFSSIYDLSLNHFPKWYGQPIYRDLRFRLERHEPFDEYIQSYGNITKTGLADYKKNVWKREKQDPRMTITSLYEDTFPSPDKSAYKFRRWAKPKPIRTEVGDLIYVGYPKDHPMFTECDPITWECRDDQIQMPKCQ